MTDPRNEEIPESRLKPQTSNLKPQTSNLKPQTSNLKPIFPLVRISPLPL
jgi:hypothetical protein